MEKKKPAAKQAEQAEKQNLKDAKAQTAENAKAAEATAAEAAKATAAQDAKATAAQDAQGEVPQESNAGAELERALDAARAEAEDYKRKWYSVSAEYENYRKRTARESAQKYNDGRADVVAKLFPIADNLDRAYAACRDDATKKGVAMVLDAFNKLLEGERIEVIDPAGEPFDAEKHEAIMAVDPAEGETSGTVREVYLKGYERDGKVLRFAQVIVVK